MSYRDTELRRLSLLQSLPRYPRKLSSRQLLEALVSSGIDASLRTVQRDLEFLSGSGLFAVGVDRQSKPHGWYWLRESRGLQIPFMDLHAAISFNLLQRITGNLLPRSMRTHLQPYFEQSQALLTGRNEWNEKIGYALLDAEPTPGQDETSQEVVYEALDQGLCISAEIGRPFQGTELQYLRYSCLHPIGLMVRSRRVYLVAAPEGHSWVISPPLHRVRNAEIVPQPARTPEGFDFQQFIRGNPLVECFHKNVELCLRAERKLTNYLIENPLGAGQQIEPLPQKEWYRVRVTVDDTSQLRSRLLEFGARVVVEAPASLRAFIRAELRALNDAYQVGC